MNNNNNRPFKR